jgi:PAS domain S-box-containing protein
MYFFLKKLLGPPRLSRRTGRLGGSIGSMVLLSCQAQSPDKTPFLGARGDEFGADFHRAAVLLGLGSGVAIGLLILALVLTKRDVRRRHLAEAKQKELAGQLNSSLEKQVRERTAELDQRSQTLLQEIERRSEAETMLRQSAERLSGLAAIIESSKDAIIGSNTEGLITSWNPAATRLFGYKPAEALGQPVAFLIPPNRVEEELAVRARMRKGESVDHFDTVRQRQDGGLIDVSVAISPIKDSSGQVIGASNILRDIAQQKQALAALERLRQELEQRVAERTASLAQAEAIIESSDDAIIGATPEGVVTSWNSAATRLLGYSAAEIMGKSLTLLIPPDRVEEELQLLVRIQRGQRVANLEAGRVRKDGRLIDMAITVSPIKDASGAVVGVSKIARDITDRKKAAERIGASLREKDALLREIHHRVKNNMQVISSLLQLQANYVQDPKALASFEDCQERIRTMALIHEKLYRTEGLAQIDFKEYLESLTEMLLRAQSRGIKIRPELQIEPVAFGIDTAIPLGLIANELISNSLKHAFTGRSNGLVRVSLRRLAPNQFQLAIGDDGDGLPDDFTQSRSLGLRLVKILTGQIKGRMDYKNEKGVNFTVTFQDTDSHNV